MASGACPGCAARRSPRWPTAAWSTTSAWSAPISAASRSSCERRSPKPARRRRARPPVRPRPRRSPDGTATPSGERPGFLTSDVGPGQRARSPHRSSTSRSTATVRSQGEDQEASESPIASRLPRPRDAGAGRAQVHTPPRRPERACAGCARRRPRPSKSSSELGWVLVGLPTVLRFVHSVVTGRGEHGASDAIGRCADDRRGRPPARGSDRRARHADGRRRAGAARRCAEVAVGTRGRGGRGFFRALAAGSQARQTAQGTRGTRRRALQRRRAPTGPRPSAAARAEAGARARGGCVRASGGAARGRARATRGASVPDERTRAALAIAKPSCAPHGARRGGATATATRAPTRTRAPRAPRRSTPLRTAQSPRRGATTSQGKERT